MEKVLKGFTSVGKNNRGEIEFRGDAKLVSCATFHAQENSNGKPYTWLTIEVKDGFGNTRLEQCMDYSKKEESIPVDGSMIAVSYREVGDELYFTRSYSRTSAADFGHNKIVSSLQAKIDALRASIDPEATAASKAARGTGRSSRTTALS
jgi:hypothetical protein